MPQLQSHVLLEELPTGPLAEPSEDVPGPAHRHAVPINRGRRQSERPVYGAAVGHRPARLPDARAGRGQVLLLRHRAGRQVRPERRRRRHAAVRPDVRQMDGMRRRPTGTTERARTVVQSVQSGHKVRAQRVGVRTERSAGPGAGAMGTAPGIQMR